MRKLTVMRPQKVLPFSKGSIMIDNNECGIVKAGKTETIEIPDGNCGIQLIFKALPPVNSNVIFLTEADGDTTLEVKITVPLKNDETTAEIFKK